MLKSLRFSLNKRVSSKGLGLFRIAFGVVLICELFQMMYFRKLIFDPMPIIQPSDVNFALLLSFWILVVGGIIVGLFTRLAVVVNFVLSVFIFTSLSEFEYHIFYTYQAISALFLFLPISRSYSVDRIIQKLKYSGPYQTYSPQERVNVWSYYLPVLLGLGFVYFDSVFYKLTSENIWLKGLGMWLPASLPMATHFNLSSILNQEFLVKFLGYLTIVFEAAFMFLFWYKRFRWLLVIIGVGLHVGILLAFPIPWFALGAIGLYILLVPHSFWRRFKRKNGHVITFYYDAECPLCTRTKIVLESISPNSLIRFLTVQGHSDYEKLFINIPKDVLLRDIHGVYKNKLYVGFALYRKIALSIWYFFPLGLIMYIPGISHLGKYLYKTIAKNRNVERCSQENCGYAPPRLPADQDVFKVFNGLTVGRLKKFCLAAFIAVCFFFQFVLTIQSPLSSKVLYAIDKTFANKTLKLFNTIEGTFIHISYTMLGYHRHPVFMDAHFKNYQNIFAVTNSDGEFLPMIDERGMADKYIYGANWVNYTWRVSSPRVKRDRLVHGLKKYILFHTLKRNGDYTNSSFPVLVKDIDFPLEWQHDFLNKMIDRPWRKIGEIGWKNGEFYETVPTHFNE